LAALPATPAPAKALATPAPAKAALTVAPREPEPSFEATPTPPEVETAPREPERIESSSDFDFNIAEASRVVKMPVPPPGFGSAGVAAARPPRLPGMAPIPSRARATGVQPALNPPSEMQAIPASVKRRRMGLYMAVGGAGVVVVITLLIVVIASHGGDGEAATEATTTAENQFLNDFYKRQPEMAAPLVPVVGSSSSGKTGIKPPKGNGKSTGSLPVAVNDPTKTNGNGNGNGSATTGGTKVIGDPNMLQEDVIGDEVPKALEPLTPDDVMAMYSANQTAVTWCYERALKDDPTLKISRLDVSIAIDASGLVKTVSMNNATTPLGTCLTQRIKGWRFRKSTSGFQGTFPLIFKTR
jgi:hypothetical protein